MSLTLSQAGSGNVKRVKLSDEATNSVQLATFQGWNLGDDIGYKLELGKVVEVWCKICARHSEKILKDERIRGSAKQAAEKYITELGPAS